MDRKKLRNDLILVGVCLFVSLGVFLLIGAFSEQGEYAKVRVDGEEIASYPLSEDREILIETKWGENLLVIKDGYADITHATCPDGLCEKQHRINKTGESLVCLPNRVSVVIEGTGEDGVDLVG